MGVSTQHADYAAMAETWKKCRDCAAGQKAVHAAGETYLAKLKDQTAEDYQAYVSRASFYNAFWRTVAGMKGLLFRDDPQTVVPAVAEPMHDDVTMSGVPLSTFGQMLADEVVTVGRAGVLADYPTAPVGTTLADAKRMNLRPTLALYKAESIINWRMGMVNNQHVVTMVVLEEQHTAQAVDDEFGTVGETRYRVLDLAGGKYRVRVFKVNDKGEDEQIGGDLFPLMGNQPMGFIPFVFFGPDDTTPTVYDPPLIDLADMNLSHYRTTADLEHGAHFTGLPTPVVSGYTKENEGEKLYIGSTAAWVFPDPQAKATYLEFTGQGLGALERLLDRKEQQMAVLGARMLEAQKRAVESAESAAIHRKGEESILSGIASVLSLGMTRALGWFAAFAGATGEVKFEINKDFLPMGMSPQMLTALVQSWQGGAISSQALFENLKAGQLYEPDATFEDEEARIKSGGPVGVGVV